MATTIRDQGLVWRFSNGSLMPDLDMANRNPQQVSERLRKMADAIDNSKNPDPARVAADVRELIASIQSKAAPKAAPITLHFQGSLNDKDKMVRAAAEVAKRRPGLAGRQVKFSLVVEPAE